MANFAEPIDIEVFLQVNISTPAQEAAATRACAESSAAIRNYTKQYLELVEDDEITLDCNGGDKLYLPELPVVEVTEVVEDGETLTVDDDYKLGQHGILHRIGENWAEGIQIITVTYSHGYDEIPDDIYSVATRAASRAYQAGLRAEEGAGVPGVSSKSLGDFSVAYSDVSSGEGVMGASAARMLLMSEKDMLDKYRMKGP